MCRLDVTLKLRRKKHVKEKVGEIQIKVSTVIFATATLECDQYAKR